MQPHSWVAVVTLVALLVYVWMGVRVGGARKKCGIHAPCMTGDPELERHIRVQVNTLEWLPIFLPPCLPASLPQCLPPSLPSWHRRSRKEMERNLG